MRQLLPYAARASARPVEAGGVERAVLAVRYLLQIYSDDAMVVSSSGAVLPLPRTSNAGGDN
jgi:hypothetical protein